MTDPSLPTLRRRIHACPELSGRESRTHDTIRDYVSHHAPTRVLERLGATGLAAIFDSGTPGATVLVRAELDALPIHERSNTPHRSTNPGVMHACGHDGHATIVAGLAPVLAERPPARGRVVLLFQPAEETGAGAAQVLADHRWPIIEPDIAIALHNLPGHPMNQVILSRDVFSCASRGMSLRLTGTTGHAAHPENAANPALVIADFVRAATTDLPTACLPDRFGQVTICHTSAGDDHVFGTSPATGVCNATLRTFTDDDMTQLATHAEQLARAVSATHGVECDITWHDDFPAAVCDAPTVELVRAVAQDLNMDVADRDEPFRWSEDFGRFTVGRRGVLFGLGSGTAQPQLHHPEYDFPDELIEPGVRLFDAFTRRVLDEPPT